MGRRRRTLSFNQLSSRPQRLKRSSKKEKSMKQWKLRRRSMLNILKMVGDGGEGGGISLAGTRWDKKALNIAEEISISFGGDFKIYASKTTVNLIVRVRIEKLSSEYLLLAWKVLLEFLKSLKGSKISPCIKIYHQWRCSSSFPAIKCSARNRGSGRYRRHLIPCFWSGYILIVNVSNMAISEKMRWQSETACA